MVSLSSILVIFLWGSVLIIYGRELAARWREPVLLQPVVIFESDDWGAGPIEQVHGLEAVSQVLCRHQNKFGEKPVMTLGIILGNFSESKKNHEEQGMPALSYLGDPQNNSLRAVMEKGAKEKIFSFQLHGLFHFSLSVLKQSSDRGNSMAFQESEGGLWTESLPNALQSSWVNGSVLPSKDLPLPEITAVIAQERDLWNCIFHETPKVAVPTTFIWDSRVEAAWAEIGVRVVVTPGCRYRGRDSGGQPDRPDRDVLNGQRGESNVIYVVRDIYFEPALGHSIERLVTEIKCRMYLSRPALIETHRFNYVGPRADAEAFNQLDTAIETILSAVPSVRFLSTVELADLLVSRDPDWISNSIGIRCRAMLARLKDVRQFWRIAKLTGLAVPILLLEYLLA